MPLSISRLDEIDVRNRPTTNSSKADHFTTTKVTAAVVVTTWPGVICHVKTRGMTRAASTRLKHRRRATTEPALGAMTEHNRPNLRIMITGW